MRWATIVPVRPFAQGKTRLAGALAAEERAQLSEYLLAHVTTVLSSVPAVSEVILLSQLRPHRWRGRWLKDTGCGLNAELQRVAAGVVSPIVVIHADLPLLSKADVEALITAADVDVAIAPDRHDTGTNAIALPRERKFPFSFGPGSFSKHLAAGNGCAKIVRRLGLALDIDTPDDLAAAKAEGFAAEID
ncbi:MAG TPA: 2-phospho-L-lactate guanylyltransferase [Lacipirellulaceae bacterium]|nr:2-phospho-L-lactate guanylyltransferase [Lacipirellulaceae bacterium]